MTKAKKTPSKSKAHGSFRMTKTKDPFRRSPGNANVAMPLKGHGYMLLLSEQAAEILRMNSAYLSVPLGLQHLPCYTPAKKHGRFGYRPSYSSTIAAPLHIHYHLVAA